MCQTPGCNARARIEKRITDSISSGETLDEILASKFLCRQHRRQNKTGESEIQSKICDSEGQNKRVTLNRKSREKGKIYLNWGLKCRWDGKRWRKLCQVPACTSRARNPGKERSTTSSNKPDPSSLRCRNHRIEAFTPSPSSTVRARKGLTDKDKSNVEERPPKSCGADQKDSSLLALLALQYEKVDAQDVSIGDKLLFQTLMLKDWKPVLSEYRSAVVVGIQRKEQLAHGFILEIKGENETVQVDVENIADLRMMS